MKIIIHKGSHQIGGSVTEISTDKARIIIDMGADLPNSNSSSGKPFGIDGVTFGERKCNAVLLTHYHGDHLGLTDELLPEIPVYIGRVAKEIFLLLSERMNYYDKDKPRKLDRIKNFNTFKAEDKLEFGDIIVTPFFIDHSAYDAYMFLIEAEGKKILHTGDFRTHGFRGKGLMKTLRRYVGQVDILITEGTLLSRGKDEIVSEAQLQRQVRNLMVKNKNVFILCSSTNIDRIFSFIHANPHGRPFVCDQYQKSVLDLVKKDGSVHSSFYDYNFVYDYGHNLDKLMDEKGFCMLIRTSDYFKPFLKKYKNDCVIIYSMWHGYLSGKAKNDSLVEFLAPYKYIIKHTSGHATSNAIKDVCNTVNPQIAVIPIHTEDPNALQNICTGHNVKVLADGEVFSF